MLELYGWASERQLAGHKCALTRRPIFMLVKLFSAGPRQAISEHAIPFALLHALKEPRMYPSFTRQALVLTLLSLLGSAAYTEATQAETLRGFHHLTIGDGEPSKLSFALIREQGGDLFVGHTRELKAAKAHGKGTYLWAKQGGKTYLIDDPEIIKSVEALWQPLSVPEAQMEKLEKQMEEFTSVMEIHHAEFEAITEVEGIPDPEVMREFETEMAKFEENIEPISQQMDAVGENIEKLSERASEQTREAIAAAIKTGKAKLMTK